MSEQLEPLLVTVREARKLLGNVGNGKFWKLVKAGELELIGTERKRWVIVASLHDYVERARATTNMVSASESPSHIVQRRRAPASAA